VFSLRPAVATLPAAAVLFGLGWLAGGFWLDQIGGVLARVSVTLVASDLTALTSQQLAVAAAVGGSAPLALLVRAGISRVSRTPATLAQWATSLGFVVLGSQAGVGGALFNTARVSLPSALDASAEVGQVQLAASELALGGWALGGAVGAAIILLAVGITTAGVEQSQAASVPPPAA